jgi:hypothetical protein
LRKVPPTKKENKMRILKDDEPEHIALLEQSSRGRPAKYPWDEWLVHNQSVELERNKDYHIPTASMRVVIKNAAERRGGTIRTRSRTESSKTGPIEFLIVTFTDKKKQQAENRLVDGRDPLTTPLGPPVGNKQLDDLYGEND